MSDAVARVLHRRTGVDTAVLHGMTLARYSGSALPHLPSAPWTGSDAVEEWRSSAWLSHGRARWCAQCLREDGRRWSLRWMLPWEFACLRHGVYMSTTCIRCLSPVYFGRDGDLPRECGAPVREDRAARYGGNGTCEYPIVLDRAVPVSDDAVLGLQERIHAWLDGSPAAATGIWCRSQQFW